MDLRGKKIFGFKRMRKTFLRFSPRFPFFLLLFLLVFFLLFALASAAENLIHRTPGADTVVLTTSFPDSFHDMRSPENAFSMIRPVMTNVRLRCIQFFRVQHVSFLSPVLVLILPDELSPALHFAGPSACSFAFQVRHAPAFPVRAGPVC